MAQDASERCTSVAAVAMVLSARAFARHGHVLCLWWLLLYFVAQKLEPCQYFGLLCIPLSHAHTVSCCTQEKSVQSAQQESNNHQQSSPVEQTAKGV